MSIPYFIVRPDERERALNVVGTKVTVLASNAATQSLGITFQQGDEGTGPPPHRHDWDECFYVLKGEMEFFCDGSIHKCVPGTLVYLPRGTLHGFRFFGLVFLIPGIVSPNLPHSFAVPTAIGSSSTNCSPPTA